MMVNPRDLSTKVFSPHTIKTVSPPFFFFFLSLFAFIMVKLFDVPFGRSICSDVYVTPPFFCKLKEKKAE